MFRRRGNPVTDNEMKNDKPNLDSETETTENLKFTPAREGEKTMTPTATH